MFAIISRFGYFHAFDDRMDSEPTLSVPLQRTTIRITKNEPERELFTFDVVVPNESWYSLTGNPTVHSFKIEDQKQFKEWIVFLRNYAQKKTKKDERSESWSNNNF